MPRDPSYQFTRAITRRPGPEAVDGLRAVDTGPPDLALMLRQHADYVAALRDAGMAVTELPPLPGHPDAQFVEDTALCLPQGAVLMRPGAPSRRGEVAPMAGAGGALRRSALHHRPRHHRGRRHPLYRRRDPRRPLGAHRCRRDRELAGIVADWGHGLREVATPPGVLHFKTDCALVGPGLILATARLAATGCFAGYDVLIVPEGEERPPTASASTIWS